MKELDSTDKMLAGFLGILILLVVVVVFHGALDSYLNYKECGLLDCGITSQAEFKKILEMLEKYLSAYAQ